MFNQVRIGTILYGYCGGYFGRDSSNNKRVEAIGVDWVVAREIESGQVVFHNGSPEDLEDYAEGANYDSD